MFIAAAAGRTQGQGWGRPNSDTGGEFHLPFSLVLVGERVPPRSVQKYPLSLSSLLVFEATRLDE